MNQKSMLWTAQYLHLWLIEHPVTVFVHVAMDGPWFGKGIIATCIPLNGFRPGLDH
jgi:hypothetical protein